MTSSSKFRKLKNSFMYKTCIKNSKGNRLHRLMFYTQSERKLLKRLLKKEENEHYFNN